MKEIFLISICSLFFFASCKQSTTTTITKSSDSAVVNGKPSGVLDYYKCFRGVEIKDLEMSVSYDAYGNALEVQFKEQTEPILLIYRDEIIITPGQPELRVIYHQILEGNIIGIYEFTSDGNYDYIKYTRKEDGEEFYFKMDRELSVTNKGFRTTPCY